MAVTRARATPKSKVRLPGAARWRRRKTARPGEILEAAVACFAERGFAATRLDDVAARAGVTKGTLYLYFSGKEELFKAVVRHWITANIARAETAVAGATATTPELLTQLVTNWLEIFTTTPAGAIPKLIIAEAGNFPELARFYYDEVVMRGTRLVGGLLRRGIERGEFDPALDLDPVVFCIISPILMNALWRHSLAPYAPRVIDRERFARSLLALLLDGLRRKGTSR